MKSIWIVAAIGVLLLGGTYFYMQQTPERENNPDTWSSYTDDIQGISFRYPELDTSYMHAMEWPPIPTVREGSFRCESIGDGAAKTEERTIGERTYCIRSVTQGAAGSIYTEYTYETAIDNKIIAFAFTIKSVQCVNYENPQRSACENERATFDLNAVMNDIVSTIQLK